MRDASGAGETENREYRISVKRLASEEPRTRGHEETKDEKRGEPFDHEPSVGKTRVVGQPARMEKRPKHNAKKPESHSDRKEKPEWFGSQMSQSI